ncbi:MAG: hypothetical protein M1813_000729 [Trichoglossum hirsutum]|nr:MAG: hypothetical protein M1813_000729 [Trichoglossum hirsutum]
MPDNSDFDGKQLLTLVRSGNSPFHGVWDINLLIREIEENLSAEVIDIPTIFKGSNNYGFHLKLSNRLDIVARLARGDVNMPNYDGFLIQVQVPEVKFEACLPAQTARICASLFNFNLSLDFAAVWLRERLFEQKPKSLPIPVAPTREFCVALFTSKIEATIGNIGDMIGWEDDNNTVGPIAAAAKQSLLRLIPHIMPADSDQTSLYRLVLEHGDFGIHNMSITMDANGQPLMTSLYDWETGCIVPAILSDPLVAVWVDLVTDKNATPSFIRVPDDATSDDRAQYMIWARQYFMNAFLDHPSFPENLAVDASFSNTVIATGVSTWRTAQGPYDLPSLDQEFFIPVASDRPTILAISDPQ